MKLPDRAMCAIHIYIPPKKRQAWEEAIGPVRTFDCRCAQVEKNANDPNYPRTVDIIETLVGSHMWSARLDGTIGAVRFDHRQPPKEPLRAPPLGPQTFIEHWLFESRANTYYYYDRTEKHNIAAAIEGVLTKALLPPYFDNGAPLIETFARKRFEEITAITALLKQTGRTDYIPQYQKRAWENFHFLCRSAHEYAATQGWTEPTA